MSSNPIDEDCKSGIGPRGKGKITENITSIWWLLSYIYYLPRITLQATHGCRQPSFFVLSEIENLFLGDPDDFTLRARELHVNIPKFQEVAAKSVQCKDLANGKF